MIKRRRSKQTISLEDSLLMDAQKRRARAEQLPPGEDRNKLLEKAQQSETVARWITSEGLQPSK